jgi:integrase
MFSAVSRVFSAFAVQAAPCGSACLSAGRVIRDTARLIRADLAAAGIPYRDARGRVADFHSLRVAFSTHLGGSGASPTVRQGLMRHSDVRLSLGTYHDNAMDDLRAAVEALPEV